jgi:hypothetical protein
MQTAQAILPTILVVTLVLQAVLPRYRLLIVMGGAAASCLMTSVLGLGHAAQILADVPWDVLGAAPTRARSRSSSRSGCTRTAGW